MVGFAAKNATLIGDLARQLERDGVELAEAAAEACRVRLGPVPMTSLAFIFALVPLVTSSGAGWDMQRAMGTAAFAGVLDVTLFGLLFTPVCYVTVRRLEKRKSEIGTRPADVLVA